MNAMQELHLLCSAQHTALSVYSYLKVKEADLKKLSEAAQGPYLMLAASGLLHDGLRRRENGARFLRGGMPTHGQIPQSGPTLGSGPRRCNFRHVVSEMKRNLISIRHTC